MTQLKSSVPSTKVIFSNRSAIRPRLRPFSACNKLVLTPVEPAKGLDGNPIQQIDLSAKGDLMEVGREGEAELKVPAPTVSRRHALIRSNKDNPNELTVIDLESTNGTYINGVEVDSLSSGKLRPGDKITFGDVVFTLEMID